MASGVSQPLKWWGGKNYLAKQIISLMPRHLNYVEPFAGGLAVLLARDPLDERLWLPPHEGVSEVVNDINRDLSNFWQVIRCEAMFGRFQRIVEAVPFSEKEWKQAVAHLNAWATKTVEDCVSHAADFFVACRQSRAGAMKSFTSITKTRTRSKMNNEVSAWLSCIDGLADVHARLKRVLVLDARPAIDVIRSFDGPDTFFYLDPPYLHETRAAGSLNAYQHEMSAGEHAALLNVLEGVKGKFLLSGYRSDLYDAVALRCGWQRVDIEEPNHAAGGSEKRVMTECLWGNYPLAGGVTAA